MRVERVHNDSTKVTSVRCVVEKFVRVTNFTIWKIQMQDVLVFQGLGLAFKTKPMTMMLEDWEDISACKLNLITLHMPSEVLLQVMTEDSVTKL